MYKLKTHKNVNKFLLKHKEISEKFFEIIEELVKNPFENNLQIKKLLWEEKKYRLRIWKYRFLYEIIDKEILIYFYKADSRWSIYKN